MPSAPNDAARIFGPGRSTRMPTRRPSSAATLRMRWKRSSPSSIVPWARPIRATSMPAADHLPERALVLGRGPDGGDDLRSTVHASDATSARAVDPATSRGGAGRQLSRARSRAARSRTRSLVGSAGLWATARSSREAACVVTAAELAELGQGPQIRWVGRDADTDVEEPVEVARASGTEGDRQVVQHALDDGACGNRIEVAGMEVARRGRAANESAPRTPPRRCASPRGTGR